jgi:hypothetical protein
MPGQKFEAFREEPTLLWIAPALALSAAILALLFGFIALARRSLRTRDPRPCAHWAITFACLVLLLGVVGAGSGLVHAFAAIQAEGLSLSDRERIRANGTVEALYNLLFSVVLGGPGLAVGFVALRRKKERPANPDGIADPP